ncbi:hypothetical protein BpHYR1_039140 [Brachionus plicatilis]|uniref:Uncharacterized protein n=1 Tax=Brachionus plicatilis TaxID=10195 RepID=A0A3M7PLX2_BRAPC|nr:hypothetical protein BpHYR1_039140 [Brachionus plicatilis]
MEARIRLIKEIIKKHQPQIKIISNKILKINNLIIIFLKANIFNKKTKTTHRFKVDNIFKQNEIVQIGRRIVSDIEPIIAHQQQFKHELIQKNILLIFLDARLLVVVFDIFSAQLLRQKTFQSSVQTLC